MTNLVTAFRWVAVAVCVREATRLAPIPLAILIFDRARMDVTMEGALCVAGASGVPMTYVDREPS